VSTPAKPALSPIALKQGEGEALWFFGSLAIVKAGSETIAGRVSVTELLGRQGSGSPLHVHHREDEWFYILEGELTFWVGGRIIKAPSRVVRVWSARHPPHLHSHVARSAQPRGHRACRVRKVHAHAGGAGGGAYDSAGERCAAEPRPNQGRRGRVRARNTRPARHPFLAEPGCPDGFGSDCGLACLDKGPGPICRLVRRPEQRYPTCPSTLASFDSGLTHHPRFNGSGRFGDWASGIPHFLPSSDEEGGAPFSAGWLTGRQFIHAPPGPLIPRHVNRPKRYHRRDQPERTDSRGYPIRLNRASRLRWNRSPQSSKNPILACDSSAVIGNFRLHD